LLLLLLLLLLLIAGVQAACIASLLGNTVSGCILTIMLPRYQQHGDFQLGSHHQQLSHNSCSLACLLM
jgi:hypothetical protein